MQNLYKEVASLDKRCYEKFYLSEDILMEHASSGIANFIKKKFPKKSKIIIVVGSGNNGADGIATARLLYKDYKVSILYIKEPKSKMALLQQKRANSIGVKSIKKIQKCDVIVDAIVGTGFKGSFDNKIIDKIKQMNSLDAYKIACDVPSGYIFEADTTLTMGALKIDMFLDAIKDKLGQIEIIDLGISRELYETTTNYHLLDLKDIKLPFREKQDTHKGSFGHLSIISGEKIGATILSALSGFKFGAGLVSIVGYENHPNLPSSILYSNNVPKNTTAIACGMGLGDNFTKDELNSFLKKDIPLVIDADMFYKDIIIDILKRKDIILTPHPKEFVSLLKLLNIAQIDIDELQKNRFKYVEIFSKKYKNITLLLKGANVIIAKNDAYFINPHGNSKLAKGGSGDILAGLIASLLAQGYSCLEATIHGSLAHTKLAIKYKGADFSLTPENLIEGIGNL